MKKRIIVIADSHCGHVAGLTPPEWQMQEFEDSTTKHNKWVLLQKELWIKYINLLEKYKPFNIGFSMGDMIDGRGSRSGGTELITTDRDEQVDMAVRVHNEIRDRSRKDFKWIGVYGTDYHVAGDGEDWEQIMAERAGFDKIGSHEWVDVNGCIFDLKHHIGGSSIPHGRHTAVAKDRLWNVLWANEDYQPDAKVLLRGHVHYATFCGDPSWMAMTLPALQGMGSKFGARRMSGLIHWGIVIFDVDEDGQFGWQMLVEKIETQKAKVIKI